MNQVHNKQNLENKTSFTKPSSNIPPLGARGNPLVSIIIPTYNRAHLIGETLDSVLAQTYQNWECIIVDDGSSDNTDEVVGEYVRKDTRFKYYHRPDEHLPGGNGARNYGFKMSKGEYVNWFDSDDLMLPEKIESQLKKIDDLNLDMITCFAYIFDDNLLNNKVNTNYFIPKKVKTDIPSFDLLNGKINFSTPGPLWRKSFLFEKALFDERLKKSQEADFNFRISLNGLQFRFIEKRLYEIRREKNEGKLKSKKLTTDPKIITSIFLYYENVFNETSKIKPDNIHYSVKDKMLNYAVYRMMFQYTKLRLLNKKDASVLLEKIKDYIKKSSLAFSLKKRLQWGLNIFHITKKGHKIIHVKSLSLK